MPYNVRRAVVVGLGGTGRDAVLNIKRKYLEVYGTDQLPTTRFVVLDTTDDQALQTEGQQEIRLRPGEFVKMTVPNPRGVVQVNPEVREWFPVDKVPLAAIAAGAGQIRALGRLSIFANAPRVHAAISQAFDDVRSIKPQEVQDFVPIGDNVLVSIVGSLSGGTGSGTFLDIAYLCRSFLSASDTQVGYFLLPDVFVGKPATFNVQPNAYGALKELDQLMSMSMSKPASPLMFGGRSYPRDETPFDIVYLVNNRNRRGTVYQDVAELTELLGLGLFVSSGSTGKVAGDTWDNLRHHINSLGKFSGKRPSYTSFGVSELVLDTDTFTKRLAHEIAIRTLDRTLLGVDPRNVADDAEAFVTEHQLCEHEEDQVIDALLPPGQYPRLQKSDKLSKGDVDDYLAKALRHRERAEAEAKQEVAKTASQLTKEKEDAVRTFVLEKLKDPNGLGYTQVFLASLRTKLAEFRRELVDERDDYRKRLQDMAGRPDALRDAAEAAKSKFFGRTQLLEELQRNLKSFADQQAQFEAEAARRDGAAGLFTSLLSVVEREYDALSSLFNRCTSVRATLDDALEREKRRKGGSRPFTIELHPPPGLMRSAENTDDHDFQYWLRDQKRTTIYELHAVAVDDLSSYLLEFAYSRPAVQAVGDLTVEAVLRDLPKADFARQLRDLADLADPMWQYDAAHVAGAKRTELIYLFGVTNSGSSVLNADKLTEVLPSSPFSPELVSTGDPKRIICYKVEAAVPAFIVGGIQTYKQRYESPDSSFTYHIDKEWELSAPDLFPSADDDSRKTWSLALAPVFGLIKKKGMFYYAHSLKHGRPLDGYEVKLDQGRQKALRALLKQSSVVSEMQDAIDRKSSEMGQVQVARELEAYLADLKGTRTTDPQIQRLIEGEIADVEQYVADLRSI